MSLLLTILGSEQSSRSIDALSKLLLGIAASCYVAGIIVVNLYLGRFGFYSLGMFRLSYIMAGFWVLGTLSVSYITIDLGFLFVAAVVRRHIHFSERILSLVGFGGGLVAFCSFVNILASLFGIVLSWSWLGISFLGVVGVWKISDQSKNLEEKKYTDLKFRAHITLEFAVAIVSLGLFVSSFARVLFGQIPANIGGGKPQLIQIVPNLESRPLFARLGLVHSVTSDSTSMGRDSAYQLVTDTLSLLIATDEGLVLLSPGRSDQSISIRRETISAVIFHHSSK